MNMKINSLTIMLILFKFVNAEQLVVTGAAEPVYAHAGEDVTLSCSVDIHVTVTELQVEWRKTDGAILVLLYAHGKNRPVSQDERYSGRAEFFTEEIPKGNFSMKLRNISTEDTGEFRCEVHSDTVSASTTARITVLGYSSLHWLILGLCIAVISVVILTGALSVRHYTSKNKSQLARIVHQLFATVPQIMVSSAFILWGVTEGSTEEAVTCAAVSLLSILLLLDVAPFYLGLPWSLGRLTYTTVCMIFITVVCTDPIIQFTSNHEVPPALKITLKVFVAVFILTIVILACMQIVLFWLWRQFVKHSSLDNFRKTLQKKMIPINIILFVLLISFFALSIGLGHIAKSFLEIAELGVLVLFSINMIMFFMPLLGFVILLMCYLRSDTEGTQKIGWIVFSSFQSINMIFILLTLTVYVLLTVWMRGKFLLKYLIPITVASFGICACFIAKIFLRSFRHFYLAQKILLGIFFVLHLIFNFLYLSVALENDKGRHVRIWEFVFIYILNVTSNSNDWYQNDFKARQRKVVYFSGAFVLPLLNSVALAVALKFKADTGKQPLHLRLIVLISCSVFLFGWFVIQMYAYWLDKKIIIKEAFTHLQRSKSDRGSSDSQVGDRSSSQDPVPNSQEGSHDNEETVALSPPDPNGQNKDEMGGRSSSQDPVPNSRVGSHDNEETVALSPPDPNGPNTEEGSLDNQAESSSTDHKEANTEKGSLDNQAESSSTDHKEANIENFLRENGLSLPELTLQLIHARRCLFLKKIVGGSRCSMPYCLIRREELDHIKDCKDSMSCQMKYCASYRKILSDLDKKSHKRNLNVSYSSPEDLLSSSGRKSRRTMSMIMEN